DQLATGIRSAAVELHNEARQYQLALEAINLASRLCRDAEIQQRISNDQTKIKKSAEKAQQNAERRRRIDSCLDSLGGEIDGVLKSSGSPEEKFRKLSEIVQRQLASIKMEWGEISDIYTSACNRLAAGMRIVGIWLNNDAHQYLLALEAIN